MPLAGEAEFLKHLAVKLQDDLVGLVDEAHGNCPLEVGLVGVAIEALVLRQFVLPETAVVDVSVELLEIGCPMADCTSIRTAPASQHADARLALGVRSEEHT